MSENPIPDRYETFPFKDNLWYKNNQAHKVMRAKNKSSGRWFCVGCFHRCYDPFPVRGNKSLKKTKDLNSKTHKYERKPDMNPHYLNTNNGENSNEDYILE